jgi:hypothetical protein
MKIGYLCDLIESRKFYFQFQLAYARIVEEATACGDG